ncbi:gypsy/ty3 retroelement polyprotein [Tanacetum coccineum]
MKSTQKRCGGWSPRNYGVGRHYFDLGRKAYLLEDKQISSVGVFDEVFSTWMAFGENTRDLGSFEEETDEIMDLHQILKEVLLTERGDGVTIIKRRHRDLFSDGYNGESNKRSITLSSENNDALRDTITALIREETEKIREEIRNVASTSIAGQNGTMARQQGGNQRGLNNMQYSRVTKIEFLRVEGEDVRGWLFKCEQFFKVDGIAKDQSPKLYVPGHKCPSQMFSLDIVVGNDEEETVCAPHISLHALTDSGSTHNFLDSKTAKCQLKRTYPLQVSMVNGNNMLSRNMCKMKWSLQGEELVADMMILPLGGCEMVLGKQLEKSMGVQVQLSSMVLYVYPESVFNMVFATLTNDAPNGLQTLLADYDNVFAIPKELLPIRSHNYRIPLKEGSPAVNIRPYRHPATQKDAIESMLWSKRKMAAMCVDYKQLNKHTIKKKFPIPLIEELIDELYGSKVFSKLDLRFGYHQIKMYPNDITKTTFQNHQGHYEFLVMPFGMTNAPLTFHSLMNQVFMPLLRKFTLVFFDDILVYNPNMQSHTEHLRLLFQTMRHHQLKVKLSKCVFEVSQVEYLGHVFSDKGVATDPTKIQAMKEWPIPKNLKQLRGFLGLTGYYRRLIKYYVMINYPLTKLIRKNAFV